MKNPFSRNNSKLLMFLLIFILVLNVRSGKYTYIVNILFFGGLFFYYRPVVTNLFLRYFAVIIFLTLWGIIRGNDIISIIDDFVSFSPLILLFLGNKLIRTDLDIRLPSFLANSLLFLIPISLLFFLYMDYGIGGSVAGGRFNYDDSTKMSIFSPIIPVLYVPYLVLFFEKLNKKQKSLVHSVIIFMALFGLITLSRSLIINVFIPYFLYYGYKYLILAIGPLKFQKWMILLFMISLISLISLGIINSGIIERSGLEVAVEGLSERNIQNLVDSNLTSNRWEETENYLNENLDFFEYLFGRGMGGHKVRNDSDSYIGGVSMMHIGPSHVFLKGGIFLMLILYVPAFIAIIKFLGTPNYPISLMLLLFLIGDLQHEKFYWGIHLFFYWYSINAYSTYSKQKCGSSPERVGRS